jgi:YbbR domain-containing protein
LWLIHSLNTVYTYTFKLPVEYNNVPRNKKPLQQLPEQLSVDVKASGLKIVLMLFNRPFETLVVDFNNLKSINRNLNYVLSASRLDFKKVLKLETNIKHISPDTLYFVEKTGYQKNVPVKIQYSIRCKAGFSKKAAIINPTYISVFGDTNLIKTIDTIYSQPFAIFDVDQSVSRNIELMKPNSNVFLSSNEANIFVEVDKLIEQTLRLPISDIHKQKTKKVNMFPSFVNVRFTSLQNSFSSSDTNLFKVLIDSDKINPRTKKCSVFLGSIPGNITIMDIEPKEVELLILKN